MTVRELIKYMTAESRTSIKELSERLGYKRPTCVTSIYRREGGCSIYIFAELCEAMGYEVVVRKKRKKQTYDTNEGITVSKKEEE